LPVGNLEIADRQALENAVITMGSAVGFGAVADVLADRAAEWTGAQAGGHALAVTGR
jgi:hypothetical protein